MSRLYNTDNCILLGSQTELNRVFVITAYTSEASENAIEARALENALAFSCCSMHIL